VYLARERQKAGDIDIEKAYHTLEKMVEAMPKEQEMKKL
jgi:hypothetical protein